MTDVEFAEVVGFLSAGCGKLLTAEQQVVYFDLLGDLPAETLWRAARQVLLTHRYATFPLVAELRDAATKSALGDAAEMPASEAWGIAWRAIGRIDPEVDGSIERALAKVPPAVRKVIIDLGVADLCYGKESVGIVRSQFIKAYEQTVARARRRALLPPKARDKVEPGQAVSGALEGIGRDVEDDKDG